MKAVVKFIVVAPEDCSERQFLEWVKGEIGAAPTNFKNPLTAYDLRGNIKNVKIEMEK